MQSTTLKCRTSHLHVLYKFGHFSLADSPYLPVGAVVTTGKHVFGLLEEAEVSRENPYMHRENMVRNQVGFGPGPPSCEARLLEYLERFVETGLILFIVPLK